jgi:type I restriction enzyme S subunit
MSAGKLPEGWKKIEIGDVADVISGGTPKSGITENFAPPGEGIAWLTPADLSGYRGKYISHGARDLTTLGYSSCSAKIMPKGTVLFSSRAPIGYVAIAANEIATNQGFKSFAFTSDIFPDYAYYFLRNIRHVAEEMGTGTTFKEISGSSAKTLPFVLAPLAEQKIIAEKLETLLAQVDTTKARLEKIPHILKRFRKAVLNLETSKIAISKIRLKDITKKIGSGSTPTGGHNNYKSVGIPLVRSLNIHTHFIKYDDLAFIDSDQAKKLSSVTIYEKDVLLNITGASIGRVNITPQIFVGGRVNQHVAIIRCLQDKILPEYLHLYLASPHIQKWIHGENYGATRQALTKKMLEDLLITVPSLSEQHEIVCRVEQLFAYADTIEKQVNSALARVNNLTQSILAKAFRGELTAKWRAENPERISGKNSAAALLKKIKDEREAIKRLPKPKRSAIKKKTGKRMSKQIIKVVEALTQAGEPLSGQQLLAAVGYPGDSSTDDLEKFFLDMRQALTVEKSIVKLERSEDGQDWFSLAEVGSNE